MITNSLLNQLCHLAQTPDSIKTIRAFVLQAAMSGRLSGIVPGDTTLYDLEQIINAERKARGYKKALRAIYTSDVILTSESIPSHWRWYKFGDIAHHNAGKMLNKGRQSTGRETEYITTSNLYWGYFKLDGLRKMPIRDNELERCTATKGDLLICEGGEAGRAAVWPHNHLIAFQNHVHRARPFGGISPYYLQLYFWKLKATGEIAKHRKGVGITSMSGKTLSEILIPLPPLAEQKRIVAKVDELMALCDRLEAQLKVRDVKQAALAKAALAKFTEDPTPENLQLLFHPSLSIKPENLRKTVLNLAIKGKLVPQDPYDEPAEKLLEHDEEPAKESLFELKRGWISTRLAKLAEINGGFAFKSTDYTEKGTRVIRISDFDEFGFKDHKVVRHPFSADLQRFILEEQNILMAMTGGTVGKSYFVRSMQESMIVNQRVATIKVSDSALPSYINIVIQSEMTQEAIEKAKNSTNDNISMSDIKGFKIPLPPLAEQRKIVAKVEQLMALIETLEIQLEASQTTGEKLLEAMVAELTSQ